MATYYYDPIAGDNANAGTYSSPRLSLSGHANSAATMFVAGHSVMLARNTTFRWALSAYAFDPLVTTHNGQTWGSYDAGYGDEEHPLIDSLIYDDSPTGWSYVAAGYWQKDFTSAGATALNYRVWAGLTSSTTDTTRNSAMRKMSSAAACVAELQYFMSGNTLTVYTGGDSSAYNPFTYYGGLAMIGRTASAPVTGRFRTLSGETIKEMSFRGGVINFQSGNSDVVISDIKARYCANAVMIGITESAGWARRFTIRGVDYDAITSYTEDEGSSANWGAMDAVAGIIGVTDGSTAAFIEDIDIVDCNARGMRHAGIDIQSNVSVVAYNDSVRGLKIRGTAPGRSVFDTSDVDYGRGAVITCAGFLYENIISRGQSTQDQFSGSGLIRASRWESGRPGTTTGNKWLDGYITLSSPINGGSGFQQCTDCSIEVTGNVLVNPSGYPIVVLSNPSFSRPVASGDIRIHGNTIVDQTYYSNRRVEQSGVDYAFPSASISVQAPTYADYPHIPTIYNNAFILPSGATGVLAHNDNDLGTQYGTGALSAYRFVTYALNEGPAGMTTPYSNRQYASLEEAGLGGNYIPTAASDVYRAGTHSGYSLDAAGVVRWNPPTVGAYEVA